MNKVINLEGIRNALSKLDELAAANPERCQGVGVWDEQSVETMIMGTPNKERSRAFRERKRESGYKQVNVILTPEAVKRLEELQAEHPDLTISDLLSAALLADK